MKKNEIKVLSDRDHILRNPNMYCGGVNLAKKELLLLEDDKFAYKEEEYVEGLLKIIDEILDNSIDEFIRTNGEFANKIKININEDHVIIEDNGRGLPQANIDNGKGELLPQGVIAFTQARAGSNFSDDTKANGIGTNGVGSFLTNVMSTHFNVETNNGKATLSLSCVNNCEEFEFEIKRKKSNPYSIVSFYPDFSKFGVDALSPIYEKIIINRLMHITQTYNITFDFNGIDFNGVIEKINPTKYLKLFNEDIITLIDDKYVIGVYPNDTDDFKFTSFVNGLYMKRGGSNIDFISKNLVDDLRAKLSKKYKSIKPGDIKNKLALVCVMSDFNKLQFDSQTKETMTNSNEELREYFDLDKLSKLSNNVQKNKQIISYITEVYKIKEELAKRKLLKDQDKTPKKIRSEKYMPAINKNEYLVLLEGASAKNAITPILGRDNFGYFELKGKPLNAFDKSALEIANNVELNLLRNILGVKVSEEDNEYNYKYVLIATDADLDGTHITVLLFTFFAKFTDMLERGRVKILKTPIAVARKGKQQELVMNFDDIHNYDSSWNIDYKKGLGSWEEGSKTELGELGKIFEEHGVEKFIKTVHIDDDSLIKSWMSKDQEDVAFRKNMLMNNEFNLGSI